ncbi:MAG TPA: hypothetical protein VHI73_03100 [Solirubrobacteraceae bacterium]|nr:hypothetical protein [Solirubrobacteraceae bacterium]
MGSKPEEWRARAHVAVALVAGASTTMTFYATGGTPARAAALARASQVLPPAPSLALPALHVSVLPHGPHVRRRTHFTLRTYAYNGARHPVPGARVRLGGHRAITNRAGRIRLVVGFRSPGFVPVFATAPGYRPAIGALKVIGKLPKGEEPGERPCISGRYAVKNLADSRVGLVNPTPIPISMSTLWLRRPPGGLGFFTGRLPNTERQVYRMFVRLVSTQLEPDRDIHLVVAEPGHPRRTMITELPSLRCYSVGVSPYRAAMIYARRALIRACGAVSRRQRRIVGSATVTGVGFWDSRHGQFGVARNGMELHPLLDFQSTGCRRARR